MEYLSAAQAAARAGVRPSTVTRWVQSGKLPAQRLASGTLQIAEADLAAFLPLRDAAPRAMPADSTVALAVAQERIRGLEELVSLLCPLVDSPLGEHLSSVEASSTR